MKNNTLLKYQAILIICTMVLFLGGTSISINRYLNYKEFTLFNQARILAADQLNEISDTLLNNMNFNNASFYKGKYPVVITDLDGIVVYSDRDNYEITDRVNINEFMQTDQSFIIENKAYLKVGLVLDNLGKTQGFVAFFIPRTSVSGLNDVELIIQIFGPILIGFSCILALLLIYYGYIRNKVVKPIQNMSFLSKEIIYGNYKGKQIEKYHGHINNDVEKLYYQFHLMRDELNERRKREEELKSNQKELISCISHDLKTPITTIKAYGEGLRDGIAISSEKVKSFANIIVNKSEILTKMINDLLEHSNAELKQLSIIKKEQYFSTFINQLAIELKGLVTYQGIHFSYENSAPNLLLEFDESRIRQVIENLIDNSIKYGRKEDGKIGISICYLEEKKQIMISVWDNGNGIGITDIPFVFNKFYRGEKSRSLKLPGSGLGLSICKYIIEEHNGEIMYDGRRGQGAAMNLYLPV